MADAAAQIAALVLAVWVFYDITQPPFFVGTVTGLTSDFAEFRDKVVGRVVAHNFFSKYDPLQMGSRPLFLVEADVEPNRPTEGRLKPTEAVNVPDGVCIVLDITTCECFVRPHWPATQPDTAPNFST